MLANCCCTSEAAAVAPYSPTTLHSQAQVTSIPATHDAAEGRAEGAVSPVIPQAVMVAVRIRPLNARESAERSSTVVTAPTPNTVHIGDAQSKTRTVTGNERNFTFDTVLAPSSSQNDVFNVTGAVLLPKFIAGYNGCLFAYGQTGSGKTYTMEGDTTRDGMGVIPRLCDSLLSSLGNLKAVSWTLEATYIEIYQEQLRDLLSNVEDVASESSEPVIRQTVAGQIFLEGAVRRPVRHASDISALLLEGSARRTRGETAMNAVSSRSHAVLSLYLSTQQTSDDDGVTATHRKLNLIDLAGSERADMAQTSGARLKEGAKINLSLSTLGNVINALTSPGRSHVPYRDSKLTRLLQDSLGANAYCLMILCVSPASINEQETMSSLRFAERVKKVKVAPTISRDPAAERISALTREVARLKARVAYLEDVCARHSVPIDGTGSTTPTPEKTAQGPASCCIIM